MDVKHLPHKVAMLYKHLLDNVNQLVQEMSDGEGLTEAHLTMVWQPRMI